MLLALPILIPLATAIAISMMPQRPPLLRAVAFAGAVGILASAVAVLARVEASGIQVLQIGGWPAPFGITLVADLFSALLVVMVGIVGVVVTGNSFSGVDPRREAFGYHALLHVLLMGVSGAFLTGDIFNLYVWFEVMLIASFVLMSLYRTSSQLHAAFTYVTLNLLASALLLTAIGLLYGQAGTLNFADLARAWPERRTPALDATLSMLFVIAFGIKAGLFPLFFWLPASYHTPPAAVGALFAGLLTKVGVYALIRVFTLLFRDARRDVYGRARAIGDDDGRGHDWGAGSTRFPPGAFVQSRGHIGFTTLGLALRTPFALAGSIFYMLHHILVITNLFLVSGVLLRLRRTTQLSELGGLYRTHTVVAVLAMIPLFSLAGVPPLSGFIAKLAIVEAALDVGHYRLAGIALVVSLLTVLSMARLWDEAFWKPPPPEANNAPLGTVILVPVAVLAMLTVALAIAAEPVLNVSRRPLSNCSSRMDTFAQFWEVNSAGRQHSSRACLGGPAG